MVGFRTSGLLAIRPGQRSVCGHQSPKRRRCDLIGWQRWVPSNAPQTGVDIRVPPSWLLLANARQSLGCSIASRACRARRATWGIDIRSAPLVVTRRLIRATACAGIPAAVPQALPAHQLPRSGKRRQAAAALLPIALAGRPDSGTGAPRAPEPLLVGARFEDQCEWPWEATTRDGSNVPVSGPSRRPQCGHNIPAHPAHGPSSRRKGKQ